MATWDSSTRWDSGAHFDKGPGPKKPKHMSKVRLDLRSKMDDQLRTYGTEHKAAITGNVHFPSPVPTPVIFDASLAAFSSKLDAIAAAEIALTTMRTERDDLRADLELQIAGRGNYVELTAAGDEAKIQSAGFQVQAAPTPTSSLDAPSNVTAVMGRKRGEIIVRGVVPDKTRASVFECREHAETGPLGAWQAVKTTTKSKITVPGLVSGKEYAFRMKVLGPNELESGWSDEAICMAP